MINFLERDKPRAEALYDTVRNLQGDIGIIAEAADIFPYEAADIKDYVFSNSEHWPFAPQAEAWLWIYDGDGTPEDFVFIEHERVELSYRQDGMDYASAHELANEDANWEELIYKKYGGK
ncbi:MAG: hypothetical protein LBS85_00030 [Clostridiales Family XIII bacterium]|jgi:hypothetical protein|nr:hypothetical protein [Clostridiales Family XIII bacterium]